MKDGTSTITAATASKDRVEALNHLTALLLVRVHVQTSNAKYSCQECFFIAT